MGTPHCGSDHARWGSSLAKIISFARGATNTSLVKVLEPQSEILARIEGEFQQLLRGREGGKTVTPSPDAPIDVFCFYEEVPMVALDKVRSSLHTLTHTKTRAMSIFDVDLLM